ncbi:GNAT family N-acetyltransferase [Streptomyces sp. NBC_00385]|uniref:GNAT family N-acetyltransferase n=1 Tax=Streptomyces sp. NBC_00385 TaxID=2975733 RepID=UPI002DD84794|nr:GNAT family N-acetyltransferase [Streptomyces sp. NBC_00385]WRZ03472.1 GNAT family N-acetyltransferase [Streptomyces sp. NBC_00385]
MIDYGFFDRPGRRVTLREVGAENWREVADIAPLDNQRSHVPAMAARYLLLSMREETWNSLAVHADDTVVGHVMWGLDDEDGSHWIGGMLIDGAEQGKGLGRAVLLTMTGWLAAQEDCWTIRLAYHPDNAVAGRLYTSLGFVPTGAVDGDEVIAELAPNQVGRH